MQLNHGTGTDCLLHSTCPRMLDHMPCNCRPQVMFNTSGAPISRIASSICKARSQFAHHFPASPGKNGGTCSFLPTCGKVISHHIAEHFRLDNFATLFFQFCVSHSSAVSPCGRGGCNRGGLMPMVVSHVEEKEI